MWKGWKTELDETNKMSKISWILEKIEIGKASGSNKKCEKALLVKKDWTCKHFETGKKIDFYDTAYLDDKFA